MADQIYTQLFFEWEDIFREFSDADAMALVYAIMSYSKTGETPSFEDRDMRIAWLAIQGTIDRYDAKIKTNRKNANKGGAPKGNKNAAKTTEAEEKQPKTTKNNRKQPTVEKNNPHNHIQNHIQNQNHIQREADYLHQPSEPAEFEIVPVSECEEDKIASILHAWNDQECTRSIVKIVPMTRRYDNLRLLLASHSVNEIKDAILEIDQQGFFRKRKNDNDPITFDWFINADNFQKVVEGNYKHCRGDTTTEEMDAWL